MDNHQALVTSCPAQCQMLAHRLYGYCMRKPHCCCGPDPEETGWRGTEGSGKSTEKRTNLKYCSIGSVVCLPAPFCHAPWRPAQTAAAPTHRNCLLLSSPHSRALPPSHWCFSCLRNSKVHQISSNRTALHSIGLVSSKLDAALSFQLLNGNWCCLIPHGFLHPCVPSSQAVLT